MTDKIVLPNIHLEATIECLDRYVWPLREWHWTRAVKAAAGASLDIRPAPLYVRMGKQCDVGGLGRGDVRCEGQRNVTADRARCAAGGAGLVWGGDAALQRHLVWTPKCHRGFGC